MCKHHPFADTSGGMVNITNVVGGCPASWPGFTEEGGLAALTCDDGHRLDGGTKLFYCSNCADGENCEWVAFSKFDAGTSAATCKPIFDYTINDDLFREFVEDAKEQNSMPFNGEVLEENVAGKDWRPADIYAAITTTATLLIVLVVIAKTKFKRTKTNAWLECTHGNGNKALKVISFDGDDQGNENSSSPVLWADTTHTREPIRRTSLARPWDPAREHARGEATGTILDTSTESSEHPPRLESQQEPKREWDWNHESAVLWAKITRDPMRRSSLDHPWSLAREHTRGEATGTILNTSTLYSYHPREHRRLEEIDHARGKATDSLLVPNTSTFHLELAHVSGPALLPETVEASGNSSDALSQKNVRTLSRGPVTLRLLQGPVNTRHWQFGNIPMSEAECVTKSIV
jgi:hypothetical protein